jgi:hypothetical protein
MRVVLYMLLFPTSLFFFAVYAESLALAFGIIGTYLVMRQRPGYLQGGLAIALASITRPVGFFLNIITGIEFLERRDLKARTILTAAIGIALTGVAILIYVLYLSSLIGSLTAIVDTQDQGWLYTWKFPLVPIIEAFVFIVDNSAYPDWFSYVVNLIDLAFTLFALALAGLAILWSWRGKFRWGLTLYMLSYLVFALSRRGAWIPLNEMARWVAPLFPMYILLALWTDEKKRWHWVVSGVMGAGLLVFMALFASGRWVG